MPGFEGGRFRGARRNVAILPLNSKLTGFLLRFPLDIRDGLKPWGTTEKAKNLAKTAARMRWPMWSSVVRRHEN